MIVETGHEARRLIPDFATWLARWVWTPPPSAGPDTQIHSYTE
jgi:hypothetical protein